VGVQKERRWLQTITLQAGSPASGQGVEGLGMAGLGAAYEVLGHPLPYARALNEAFRGLPILPVGPLSS
jgi:hypothetical protein